MRCPRCNQESLNPYDACRACGFRGLPAQVEELGHVAYLLGEMETWHEVQPPVRDRLRQRYLGRRQELETALDLGPPPLSESQARELYHELDNLARLNAEVARWLAQDWMRSGPAGQLRQAIQGREAAIRTRLEESEVPAPDTPAGLLQQQEYVETRLERAGERGYFRNARALNAARAELQARRRELEIEAGLRPRPVAAAAEAAPAPVAVAQPTVAARQAPAPPPRKPRQPLTWDRVWQTLLSERTLNVLLFLGAFLLVASATTYVIYNWETLPPAVQLGFIVLFTLSFYGAGWFLRVRMGLRASGIAVTAVGSLLVPLDFYAIFVAGEVLPAEAWPWVWLVAAAVCLPIYAFTALRIGAEFFGYLVVVAAGNLLCAGLYVAGVPAEWFLAALAGLGVLLIAGAYRLRAPGAAAGDEGKTVDAPEPESAPSRGWAPWSLLADPFRFSALIATAVLLPLGIGWWLALGAGGFDFDASLAGAWALGAVLYLYTAIRERSPLLGRAAAGALPVAVLLLLRLAFDPWGVEAPWYALGWAALAPLYLWAGHRWLTQPAGDGGDEVRRAHGGTATSGALVLAIAAAGWAMMDPWAAAAAHAVLTATAILGVGLWQRPRALPLASLLALSAATFAMAAGHLAPAELCLGWALLALVHIVAALGLRTRPAYAAPLYGAGLAVAALALLPPLVFQHELLLTYVVGHWLALAGWLIWLDRGGKQPGLEVLLARLGHLRRSALHWAAALPAPAFVALLYTRFWAADAWLGLLMAGTAWACFGLGQLGLRRMPAGQGILGQAALPWLVVAWACSLAGPALAFGYSDQALLGLTILAAAALYFVSAWTLRADLWLIPGGLALPLGLLVLLDFWAVPWARQSVALAGVAAAYLLVGLWLEQRRGVARDFMASLYVVAHLVAVVAVGWGLAPAVSRIFDDQPWPDSARLWAAGGQLILGCTYGLLAWFHGQRRWAHAAAWLGVLAGGLVATAYSLGRGSSALKAALLAVVYVLAERALSSGWLKRRWAGAQRAWPLYRDALLSAGWTVSAGAVGLALVRNLLLLGGGPTREAWAIAGLLTVTALYGASAWLFGRRRFVWLAAVLVFAPWTLLTYRGWFLWAAEPALSRYGLSWAILACLELGLGILLTAGRQAREDGGRDYGLPLRAVANVLLPLALLWAVADAATSSLTWGLGLLFYTASALADRRRGLDGWRLVRFVYPAAAVIPVWAIYLLKYGLPAMPYEGYGLLLLALALPLLAVGRRLRRIEAAYGLPFYLACYGTAIVGTLLVAHQPSLLASALAFDGLLCLLSAWVFGEVLWVYPAAALAPAGLLTALVVHGLAPERRGWWLIGLGAAYLLVALRLRARAGGRLRPASLPLLAAALAVTALGLLPSSLDDVGALWGYLAAALVYGAAAVGLGQPLLAWAAAALLAVPYGVTLTWVPVTPANYGLALFPGVALALGLAHLLDRLAGRPQGSWDTVLVEWWGAPFYAWGYLGALVAAGLSWDDPLRLVGALGLAALVYLHATWRFRLRGALLLAGALAQGAALAAIDAAGWMDYPGWAALAFLPVTAVTALLALAVERLRGEGSPLRWQVGWPAVETMVQGWSRPLYLLLTLDLLVGQGAALAQYEPGAAVTVAHALLLALLATAWADPMVPFAAAGLGLAGLLQGLGWAGAAAGDYPPALALLALGYGLGAYGLERLAAGRSRAEVWRRPLEWAGLALAALALVWAAVAGLGVVRLVVRTFLGWPVTFGDYAPQVRMWMWVLAIDGLLYLTAALVRRKWALAYGAVALLLGAWALWWRFLVEMVAFQWYAVPAGAYLLALGWAEWHQGRKALARWIDRAAVLVWLGTAWWQSLPGVMDSGWPYALIMGAESLLLVWWGSARRLKGFLYAGAAAVVLNALTQSIEPLLSANRWIVFGLAGLLIVSLAVLVERNLQKIREMSLEMRQRLEGWE